MVQPTTRTLLSLAAALLMTASAVAEEEQKPSAVGSSAALFKQLDTSGDGKLSTDEVAGDKLRLLKRLIRTADLNSDGYLTAQEFVDGLSDDQQLPVIESGTDSTEKPKPSREPFALFKRLDADGDGKVQINEVPEQRREFFKKLLERADSNHDNMLDRKEAIKLGTPGERIKQVASKKEAVAPDVDRLVERALAADQNDDNRLSIKEAPKFLQKPFAKIDSNSDGQLDAEELKARFSAAQKKQQAKPGKSKKSDKPSN